MKNLGLLARAVFVVDTEGVVRYKELCEEVGNEPDFEKALEEVKNQVRGSNDGIKIY